MIFIIPVILGAVAIVTGSAGVIAGIDGKSKMNEAKEIGENAETKYQEAIASIKQDWENTQQYAEEYGQLQIDAKVRTIGRFVRFIERLGQSGSIKDTKFLAGLEGTISHQQIQQYKAATLEAQKLASGGFKAIGAAGVASQGAITAATLFGTASTGTAIGGLSGAAATNATLAWLGGGSLAAGGGGMALGTIVLGGIAVGPALAIGGFMLSGQGEKALTKAIEYEAKVNVEVEEIDASRDFLQQVRRRIDELRTITEQLNYYAVINLNELESRPFDKQRSISKFQQTAFLIKALAEITSTPILDNEGNLNAANFQIKERYKNIHFGF